MDANVVEQDGLTSPGPLAVPSPPSVYQVLAEHQRSETWELREVLAELQRWEEIFSVEFKLQLPSVVLCVEKLRSNCLGHFRETHNAFGLRGEVAISRRHLEESEFWRVLGTLLHELLHAWQSLHGTPGRRNHHNE